MPCIDRNNTTESDDAFFVDLDRDTGSTSDPILRIYFNYQSGHDPINYKDAYWKITANYDTTQTDPPAVRNPGEYSSEARVRAKGDTFEIRHDGAGPNTATFKNWHVVIERL